jgi:hypothetical protein
MLKNIIVSSLTLAAIVFGTTSNASANLSLQAIDLVNRPHPSIAQLNRHNHLAQANDLRDRSMSLVEQGLAAQEAGNEIEAMLLYVQAVEIDMTNPAAFMAAGNLLGNTKEGTQLVQAAAILFNAEQNETGYKLAMSWLAEHGVSE